MAIEQTPELERALQQGAERNASDVYLLPDEPLTFRINGEIKRTDGSALSAEDVRRVASAAVGEERLAQIGPVCGHVVVSCGLPGAPGWANGRITIARSLGRYTIVTRLVRELPTPAWIRMPEGMIKAAHEPNGLLLFAGPTGSGKTTTIMTMLEDINRNEAAHICTVEDPIGYVFTPKKSLIQQREVGVDVRDNIAGIAAAMQQDLDILMVGELRSVEEVQAVITAVNTGHLVFTQVHASTPQDAIQRLIDIQPPEHSLVFRRDLAHALVGASAQRLLPRAGGKGRTAAYGVLIPDDETRQAIIEGRNLNERKTPLPKGCQTLAEDIEKMRTEEVISEETAREWLAKPNMV